MTGQQIEHVKAQRVALRELVHGYEVDIARVMPTHVSSDAFFGLAVAYVRRSPELLAASFVNPGSLILALRECAALGHMPIRGRYALVPFNDKNAPGGKSVVGIEEWRGVVDRIHRAGGLSGGPYVETVRAEDTFVWRGRDVLPDHRFNPLQSEEDRGPLVGVYAWGKLPGGGLTQIVLLNKSDIDKVRRNTPFWRDWEEPMWRKTALHRLEGFVPTSVAYMGQLARSELAASEVHGVPDVPTHLGDPHRVDSYVGDADDLSRDDEIMDHRGPGDVSPDETDWPPVAQPGSAT